MCVGGAQVRASVETSILEVPGFTSKYISKKGLGLDGCLQMAFQLAHYQLHGHSGATYESANQSAYKHGRTETVSVHIYRCTSICIFIYVYIYIHVCKYIYVY